MSKRKIESKSDCSKQQGFSNESNIKRFRSSAKISGKFKRSLFQEKSEDVDVNSNTRKPVCTTTSEAGNNCLKNVDVLKSNVNCDGIRFLSEDDDDETTLQTSTASTSNEILNWGDYYLKQFKNLIVPVSSKLSNHFESKEVKDLDKNDSTQQVPNGIDGAFEDGFSRVEIEDECHFEEQKVAIISNEWQSDSLDYFADGESLCDGEAPETILSTTSLKNETPGHFNVALISSSTGENDAIDKVKINNKNDSLDFTPKCTRVTDTIHLISESESENGSGSNVDLSLKKLSQDEASKINLPTTFFKNETPGHFSEVSISSSILKNNVIYRFKKNRRKGFSSFTLKCAKVTDTIKFISESESENDNDLTVDLALKKSTYNNVDHKVNLINNNTGSSKFVDISNSVDVADTIRLISESANEEVEKAKEHFEISNNEEENNSGHHSTVVNPSFDLNEKILKVVLVKLDVSQYKKKGETYDLSSKKTLRASKLADDKNVLSTSETDVDKFDLSKTADSNKNSKHHLSVANRSFQKIDDKFQILGSNEIENNALDNSSKDSLSPKKTSPVPIIVSGDEINFLSDSENEDENVLKRRSQFDKKSSYVWDFQLSPFKLDFGKRKRGKSEEKELAQLNETTNKTDKEKQFLKIVGNTKLPSFFLGSVSECTFF